MSYSAFTDESLRFERPGKYILAAAVIEDALIPHVREALAPLANRHGGFHWTAADGSERLKAAELVAGLPALHIVVVGSDLNAGKQERARRSCLKRLLYELDAAEVHNLVMDSRGPAGDARDLKMVATCRANRAIGTQLRISHAKPHTEPLLWVADAVAGAVGLEALGTETRYWDALSGIVERHDIELR